VAAKEYEIAFKLGAELESTFARTFSSASKDFKDLQSQVSGLSKGSSGMTRPIRNDLRKTQTELRNTESATGKVIGAVKSNLGNMVAAAGVGSVAFNSFKKSMDFEAQLDSIQVLGNVANEDMKKIEKLALDLGAKTKFSALEAAQGMEELIKAGLSTEKVVGGGLEAALNLASAGDLGLAEAAEIMSTAMNAYKKDAISAATASDILAGAANASATSVTELKFSLSQASAVASGIGMSFKDTNIALGLFANNGLKGSDAGTSLKTMLLNLTPISADAAGEFERLGLTTFDATKALEFLRSQGVKPASQSAKDITDAMMQYSAKVAGAKVGSDQANKAFREMAFNAGAMSSKFFDSNGQLQSLDIIAGALKESLKGLNDQQRQVALKTMFGTDAVRAANILYSEGAEGVKKFNAEMSQVTALEVATKRMDNAKGAIEQFRGAMETLQITTMTAFLPTMQKLATGAANVAEHHGNAVANMVGIAAVAFPLVKVSKGIMKLTKSANTLGSGAGVATRAIGLMGPALGLLTNPIGLAIAGVGALGLGWVAYQRHQEKARQELINMGKELQESSKRYKDVADKAKLTNDLVWEYRELDKIISTNTDSTRDLSAEKQRLADITKQLQQLHPQTITQYDVENGKIKEKLGLVKQESDAERELAKLKLEKEVAEKSKNTTKLGNEIGSLEKQTADLRKQKDAIDAAIPALKTYMADFQKIMGTDYSEERVSKILALHEKVKSVGQTVGLPFEHLGFLNEDTIDDLVNKRIETLDKLVAKSNELSQSKASYDELYQAQKKLIEMNLGTKLEDQAKKFNSLSDEEKRRFNEALASFAELNKQMTLLPSEKKINVKVLYEQSGQLPERLPVTTDFSGLLKDQDTPKTPPFLPFKQYADGGFANEPSIFGEAGPEAAIPINNKPRSHAILDQVNRMMGHDNGGGGSISVTFSPNITVQGGGSDVQQQVTQALKLSQAEFKRMFEDMMRQERRLGFG